MPIPKQVIEQVNGFEQQGYSASEILQGLKGSKYNNVISQVNDFQTQGYDDNSILEGLKAAPIEKSFFGEAVDTWKEGASIISDKLKTGSQKTGEAINTLTTPITASEIKSQISQAISPDDSAIGAAVKGIKEYWGMGAPIKSALGLARGIVEFPYHVLQADMALKQGNVQPAADIIKGLIHFIGRPTGAADIAESLVKEGKLIPESFTQMGEAWVSDPAGSLLAIVPFVKGGLKTIIDSSKKFKEGIKPDVKPAAPEPIKSPAEQTIEAEQAKMREAQAQGLNREQQLEKTQVNAIKTGEAVDILIEGKSLRSHIKEGIESGLKPEVLENNIRELLNIQYAKEPNPLNKIKVIEAQKQLNKDVSGAFEDVFSSEGKGQKGYAKDAEGQMQDVISPQEPSVPSEAQKQAAPSPKRYTVDEWITEQKKEQSVPYEFNKEAVKEHLERNRLLKPAKTGLEGKLPSTEFKGNTALEQAVEDAKTREAQKGQLPIEGKLTEKEFYNQYPTEASRTLARSAKHYEQYLAGKDEIKLVESSYNPEKVEADRKAQIELKKKQKFEKKHGTFEELEAKEEAAIKKLRELRESAKPRELHTYKVGDVVEVNGKKVEIKKIIKDSFGEPQRVSVQPVEKVTKTIKDKTFDMPQKPYDISPFTEVEGKQNILSNEAGFVKIPFSDPSLFEKPKHQIFKTIKDTADYYVGVVSARLANIAPELKFKVRRTLFNEGIKINRDMESVKPFIKKFKQLDEQTKFNLTKALINSDIKEAVKIMKENNMAQTYNSVAKTFARLKSEAQEAGYDIKDIPNYFVRVVGNPKELLNKLYGTNEWSAIDMAIKEAEQKFGTLTDEHKAQIADTMLRGFPREGVSLKQPYTDPTHTKSRTLKQVPEELVKYYLPANEALIGYIQSMNTAIEKARFFGKHKDINMPLFENQTSLDASIGNIVMDLKQHRKITPEQEVELKSILGAVFQPRHTGKLTRTVKEATYIATLGNVGSALTQIQDLALVAEKSGFWGTARGAFKREITTKDIGIDSIAHELQERGSLGFLLDTSLKLTGFKAIDKLGKETLLNAQLVKYRKMAGAENTLKLDKKLVELFGEDANKVKQDLRAGRNTEDVKFLLFNELSDIQPITRAEVPEAYLRTSGGKIFYALKTYQIKLFDVYRSEVFGEIRKGNVREGITKLIRLSSALAIMGATADELKDFIFGRQTDFSDKVIDNVLKLGGFSKYTTWIARKEGIGTAMWKTVSPPIGIIDDISKDVGNAIKTLDTEPRFKGKEQKYQYPKYIPLFGKPYYWWLGKGFDIKEKDKIKRQSKERRNN